MGNYKKKRINFVGTVPSIVETIFYLYKKRKKKLKILNLLDVVLLFLKKIQKNFKKKFNVDINNIYGMSEIGVATMDNPKRIKYMEL